MELRFGSSAPVPYADNINGTSYTRTFNTNWQTTFSCTFDLGSTDYIAIMLQRSDGVNVDSSFPASNVSVVFRNF